MGKRAGKLASTTIRVYSRRPPAPVTKREREEQRVVLERLRAHALTLAAAYRLPLRSLDAERPQVKRRYGICYDDGSIRIRLRHARTGQLLKYSSLVDTLCHELAHLKYFEHGRRFSAFYEKLLAYARRGGIYRPSPPPPRRRQDPHGSLLAGIPPPRAPRPPPAPAESEQLELFPSGGGVP